MIDCMSASTVAYIIWLLKDNYMRQPVLKNKLIASTMDVNKKLKERIIVTINKTARRGHAHVNGVIESCQHTSTNSTSNFVRRERLGVSGASYLSALSKFWSTSASIVERFASCASRKFYALKCKATKLSACFGRW